MVSSSFFVVTGYQILSFKVLNAILPFTLNLFELTLKSVPRTKLSFGVPENQLSSK